MSRWEKGRPDVDKLINDGRITRVVANRELAGNYLTQARNHLAAAAVVRELDAAGAFTLCYDAARQALAAVLVNQGLKPRGLGSHAVLLDVVIAQLEPPRQEEIRAFDWMRRLRNDTQYPNPDSASAAIDDVDQAIPAARAIVDRVAQVLDLMPPY